MGLFGGRTALRRAAELVVDNPARFRELSCNSEYADFLALEIVPWARANYHA